MEIRRIASIGKWLYRSVVPLFVLMPIIWLVLNKFRSALYDAGINDSDSSYYHVIAAQDNVYWIALALFPLALVIALYEIVHWLMSKIFKRHDP